MRVAHKDVPANPFEAAKRSQSQREYFESSEAKYPQEDSTGTREDAQEKDNHAVRTDLSSLVL